MSTPIGGMNDISDLVPLVRAEGAVKLSIGGCEIALDLTFVHERRYLVSWLTGLRYPQHDIDVALFRAFIVPGDTVADAGANIGITAALALECGAVRVHCIEAEKSLAERLAQIRDSRIVVHHCAVGHGPGCAELFVCGAHNQGHTLSPATLSQFRGLFAGEVQTVAVRSLPSILDGEYCGFWKLDVEGAEPDVVRGALELLPDKGPRVVVAELFDHCAGDVLRLLAPWYEANRAALRQDSYELELLDPVIGPLSEEYTMTSPMYVFRRRGECPPAGS